MSKNRLIKYEKLLAVQQRRIDLIKQQIGSQRYLVGLLVEKRQKLIERQQSVGNGLELDANATSYLQQCDLAMVNRQREINAVKMDIAAANEKLDHLLHSFRESNQKLKSWEKLVENETEKAVSAALNREMKLADERFLATQFAGGTR